MMMIVASALLSLVIGFTIGWIIRNSQGIKSLRSSENESKRIKEAALEWAENKKKELILEGQLEVQNERRENEAEIKMLRQEAQKNNAKAQQRLESLEAKSDELDKTRERLNQRESSLDNYEASLKEKEGELIKKLEEVAGLSKAEAQKQIRDEVVDEAKRDAEKYLKKIDEETQAEADRKAQSIITSVIGRICNDVTSSQTAIAVEIPNDEMKGRIIGKEGRNVRAIEVLTGCDLIIDDTPETVTISSFDPVRREVARLSLERLVLDGRIHPTRIEEIIAKTEKEVNRTIIEKGEKAIFDLGISNMSNELIKSIGRLYYRTSYGQNILSHCIEVAKLSGMIAGELRANQKLAVRAGLLHDIGKGIDGGSEGHAVVGADLARRLGENADVENAIRAHHDNEEAKTIEAVIVKIADAISAARPGARKENIENYIKRLEDLEKIALSYNGIDKAYAIQAGREMRIIVNSDKVNDVQMREISKGIARRIETEISHPGKIKITMIRETRVVEYAE